LLGLLDGLLDDGRIELMLRDGSGAERTAVLEAGGREAELTEPGALLDGLGFKPYAPELPAVIGSVVAGEAAALAGLEPGDRILSADAEPIDGWARWVAFVQARPGQSIELAIERDGERRMLDLIIGSATIDGTPQGRIGAAPAVPEGIYERLRSEQRYAPAPAAAVALARTWEMSALTLRMLWRMVLGDVSVKNISGPINIAQYAGYTASAGVVPFLNFLAVVSLSLGILNLMPIPLLDGGQLLYQVVEIVKGSPVSERAQLYGQQIGIALLLLIMSFAFYNDISRLVG
jgi:regulator of sigma E protease